MKYFTLLISLCALVTVVVWTYNMNYETRQTFNRIDVLRSEIAADSEAIQVLRVEWAWLNSPERLKQLVKIYREDLELTYLQAEHFAHADGVPYPPHPEIELTVSEARWSQQ